MPRRSGRRPPKTSDTSGQGTAARVERAIQSTRAATTLAIPLPAEGRGSEKFWGTEIEDAQERLKKELPEWRRHMSRYDGDRPALPGIPSTDLINVNVNFYVVEQKKPQLFHQQPTLTVRGLRPETKAAAPVVKAILDAYLSEDRIDATALMDDVLNDILIPAGIGPTKIGYEAVSVTVKVPTGRMVPQLDPLTQQPLPGPIDPMTGLAGPPPETLALGADGEPETQEQKKRIFCRYYWDHLSPDDFLSPVGFLSTRFDDAPWTGFRFYADREELETKYGVEASAMDDVDWTERLVDSHDRTALQTRSVACGYELWYRASLFDPSELNPERIRRIVLLAKKSRPNGGSQMVVVHENSPWQRFDPVGRFTGGMVGFPLHVFSTRSRINSAYPKSDCAILKDVADEKCLGRSQMIMQRKRNLPLRGINIKSPALTRDTVEKIESGEIQSLIPFEGQISESDFHALPMAHYPQENFSFDNVAQQDIDRLAASGANQQGLQLESSDTAYEASLIQRATENRQAKERARLLTQYARGCKKLFSLIQLFATDEELIEVVGRDGQARFASWDRTTIQGDFGFKFNPDSSLRIDAAQNREMTLRFANIVSNNPNFNQGEVAGMICDAFGYDRMPLITQPKPAPPEPPKATFSIRGEDLNPMSPQYLGVVTYLKAIYGITLPPPQPVAPELIKAPEGIEPVQKHDLKNTGALPGRGPM